MQVVNSNIQNLVSNLGQGVSFPNAQRNYSVYNEQRTSELVNLGEQALPYIDSFLKQAWSEEQVTDSLQVLDKMLDRGVKGIDKMYPTIAKFNDVTSPNVQVLLAGIYRKTLVPDAFGPLNKMLIRQTLTPNSPYFDPTEEIGGAIMEYLTNQSKINSVYVNR
ncbi:hypothetical protein IJ182_08395 [bacterium]|nr:hypothetical protein [bacterium]